MTKQIENAKFINLRFFNVFMFASLLNAVNSEVIANECGTISIPNGQLIDGNQTQQEVWPFAVAIYEIKEYALFCGGTLISRRHILTAAHCVNNKRTTEIAVLLGGVKHANITEIHVHPDWESISKISLDADIAILVLNSAIVLTNDIQVVCLPSDGDSIDNASGFIIGWDSVQLTTKHSIINVFNNSYCYAKTQTLSAYVPPHTFCGGVKEVSFLKEVSGGGFFINLDSVWVQHGVVASVTNSSNNSKDQTIVSLVNLASFKIWIIDTVRQSGGVIGEAIKGKINLECSFIHLYYSYACVAHGLDVRYKNFGVDKLIGTHESNGTNSKVELIQFHNGTMHYLVDGIGKLFPNLKSLFIGYSDSLPLNTTLIRRSNFQNMENLFEIAIHQSEIDWIYEDLLWDLPNLERFQLDGMLLDIPKRTFERNIKLKEVYLASNALVFLPRNLFKNNVDLRWVNFAHNSLKFIETDFTRLPNIQYIFLTGNLCINQNWNKTAEVIANLFENITETQVSTNDSNQVSGVTELQRLINSNCISST